MGIPGDPTSVFGDPGLGLVLALCVFDILLSQNPRPSNPFIILKGKICLCRRGDKQRARRGDMFSPEEGTSNGPEEATCFLEFYLRALLPFLFYTFLTIP